MKILHSILAVLFLIFAGVQINDPDPVLWILIYGAMAAICVMAIFEYYIPKLLMALSLGYLIYLVILFPGFMDWYRSPDRSLLFDDLAKMQYLYIEEAREFLGLAICVAVLGFYLIRSRKK
jgi:Transmembrane family 220, helix